MPKRDRYIQDETLKDRRRRLRTAPTKAEYVLWQELKGEKLGYKFRRQTSIGPFIADFYCHELLCIIEVDGPIHEEQQAYDERRETYLKKKGYAVIRFKNDEVLFEREKVIQTIVEFCNDLSENTR